MSNDSASPNCDISAPLLKENGKTQPSLNKNEHQPKANAFIDQTHNPNLNKVDFAYPPLQEYIEGKQPHYIKNVSAHASGKFSANQLERDLAAMSVLSLLDNKKELDSQMDTNKDLEEVLVPRNDVISELNAKETLVKGNHSSRECKTKVVQRQHSVYSFPKPIIYFNDGKRSVDFVLVWDTYKPEVSCTHAQNKRNAFEKNLIKEGLELENVICDQTGLQFIKVHAPKEVLRRYSEILKLRMPMNELLGRQRTNVATSNFLVEGCASQWEKLKTAIFVDTEIFPEISHRFTAIYSRDKEYLFDSDSPCFFTPAIHSRIVQFILDRKRFSDNANEDFAFGIERLLNDGIYTAAYPLHDGDLKQSGSMRKLLYDEWASVSKWYRYQPLDYIKEYFGVKIGLYFAWLGFYTHMLIPAAIVGLVCFIYSCLTVYTHEPCQDVCNDKFNATMCPQCDDCDYWFLNSGSCTQFRMTYLFDNFTTVLFAVFMSVWATIFLEMWKRYSAEITHRWDLTGFDIQEEHPRPQYLARLSHVKRKQINIITNTMEPHVPFWRLRVPATIFSFSIVILLIMLAFATVVGVILYRISVIAALRVHGISKDNSDYITLFTTITAASINLCCIVVFNWMYTYLAESLTELEFIRTQSEFDDSLTLKIYLLQFVNYYASIFYIAFFKGKFIGHPKSYIRFFGHRQEECSADGCLMELCIQLAIIMIGKQAVNSILEMLFPLFYRWINSLKLGDGPHDPNTKEKAQWIKDFKLVQWGPRSLFPEYLEMVLQYGFVTIFVAAFPLAPLFALLNNILEMRLDARKLLTYFRRPVTQRVRDIGVWYRILDSIGKLAVITNAFIIAFTSNFIPRLVYRLHVSKDFSLNGFLEHSLAFFNTSDFKNSTNPDIRICRYPDYREPPGSPNEYQLSAIFWHILAARLAFVVVFENTVAAVIILVKWLIPDIPATLRDQIRRENFITNEIIINQETMRAKESVTCENMASPPIVRRITLGLGACPTSSEDWDQILDKSLSGSDLDLLVHSNTYPVGTEKNNESYELQTPTSV